MTAVVLLLFLLLHSVSLACCSQLSSLDEQGRRRVGERRDKDATNVEEKTSNCTRHDLQRPTRKGKLRWAVVCLIRQKDSHNSKRNKALASYLSRYSSVHDFSVLMFSEDKLSSSILNKWTEEFQDVGPVSHVDTTNDSYVFNGIRKYGYKWMCKFFTVDMYNHIKDYDYYIRVDSDNILEPPKYDVFQWAIDHDVQYGYVIRKFEPHHPTRSTLPAFVRKYTSKCGLRDKIAIQQPPLSDLFVFNFYNNVHLGKVSFFNSPQVRHFLVEANLTGLYEHRWGDSTIQAYAVRLFMKPWQVQQMPEVSYYHISHSNALVTSDPSRVTQVPQAFPSGNWTINENLSAIELVKRKGKNNQGIPSSRTRGHHSSSASKRRSRDVESGVFHKSIRSIGKKLLE